MATVGGSPVRTLKNLKMLEPLALRDFRWLWAGMTVSLLGDGVFLVALAWQVYDLSNVPAALSVVGVALSAPHLVLLLLGGVLSDRADRRRVMITADLIRATAVLCIGLLSIAGALRLWQVIGAAIAYGGANAFFGPAFDAIVPELVPTDRLAQANSLDQFVRPTAGRLAGPALGGLIIGLLGVGSAFVLDAATFVVSIVCIWLMHPRARRLEDGAGSEGPSTFEDLRTGFRYVKSHVWLWGTFLAATLAYLLFMGPVEVLLPYIVKNDLGGDATLLGLIFAMGGLGAIGGALIVGQRRFPRRYVTFMYLTWALATFAVAGYGLARASWQAMVASLLFNGLEAAGTIVWATMKHRMVPLGLLGRVSSFDWFISIGLVPASFALTGPVASVLGARATLVWAGILGGCVTLSALFLPGMRDVERQGTARTGEPGADMVPAPAGGPAPAEALSGSRAP
jgi:MFS family permease